MDGGEEGGDVARSREPEKNAIILETKKTRGAVHLIDARAHVLKRPRCGRRCTDTGVGARESLSRGQRTREHRHVRIWPFHDRSCQAVLTQVE